ncbi:hypothetical protein COCNU_08G005890 [Cocos nucifera]|uniref:Uncharacterized protein n=1 Tax=Cocos nucifera TaxID=13894 RepID=A0A8K0N5Q5_COCNU|nr:hypothetical protein COCNU_08G005890 [Cocos nucifera]
MGVREVEILGRKLSIHERDDTNDPSTGQALTGSWLWESALYLAKWMAGEGRAHLDLAGKTVLELGAGTGLPGLAAAVLGAARVVLTDVALLLPGLRANVEVNGLEGQVEVRELRWGQEEAGEEVDVVVMSDVFFDPEEMKGLGRTLRGVWGKGTRAWAASEVRASVGDCLEELGREGFEVVELPGEIRPLLRAPGESSVFAVYLISRKGTRDE